MATKEVTNFLRDLRKQGLTPRMGSGGHYQLLDQGMNVIRDERGMPLMIAASPSDWRWRKNIVSKLRQYGVSLGVEDTNGSEKKGEKMATGTVQVAHQELKVDSPRSERVRKGGRGDVGSYERSRALEKDVRAYFRQRDPVGDTEDRGFLQERNRICEHAIVVARERGMRIWKDGEHGNPKPGVNSLRSLLQGNTFDAWKHDLFRATLEDIKIKDQIDYMEARRLADVGSPEPESNVRQDKELDAFVEALAEPEHLTTQADKMLDAALNVLADLIGAGVDRETALTVARRVSQL